MRLFFIIFSFLGFSFLFGEVLDVHIAPLSLKDKTFMKIKVLDEKELAFSSISGISFGGISDIAYNTKTHNLHLLGDRGMLFTFKAIFSNKIETFKTLRATRVKNRNGKLFRHWNRDSEGLTLDNKNRLFISFEGQAKIGYFHKNSKKYGRMIRKYPLPYPINKMAKYRHKNKSLEALTWHKKYGLLTATELPLKKDDEKLQTIYSLKGKQWHFKAEPEGKSSVVAMEVMDDGNILVLERSFSGIFNPFVVTLKKVYLNIIKNHLCKTEILAKMNNHKGWKIDNFEGLTKVSKNGYLMVSDDNYNFFERTLLIYFEVL